MSPVVILGADAKAFGSSVFAVLEVRPAWIQVTREYWYGASEMSSQQSLGGAVPVRGPGVPVVEKS